MYSILASERVGDLSGHTNKMKLSEIAHVKGKILISRIFFIVKF